MKRSLYGAFLARPCVVGDGDVPVPIDGFAGQGEERVPPSFGSELVLGVEAGERAAAPGLCLAAGPREPELDSAEPVQLEESPRAARDRRGLQAPAPEGRLVVAVEDADERLQVEGQERNPRELESLLDATSYEQLMPDEE